MNFKEIKELIEILDNSNLTEINIEDNKGSIINLKKEKKEKLLHLRFHHNQFQHKLHHQLLTNKIL